LAKNIELLRAVNIRYSIKGKSEKILKIDRLRIKKGECIFVLGKNGAGKSSLLGFLGGYLNIPDAAIFWKGRKIIPLADRLVPGFEHIILVKQDPEFNPFLRVEEEMERSFRSISDTDKKKKLSQIIRSCHLKSILKQKTGDLSGGEKRRLALALALILEPELILLDEPFSDLDAENKQYFYVSILEAIKERSTSFIIVSHNGEDARWLADEIWILEKGKVLENILRLNSGFMPNKAISARLLGWQNIISISYLSNSYITENPFKKWIFCPPHLIKVNNHSSLSLGLFRCLKSVKEGNDQTCFWQNDKGEILISSSGEYIIEPDFLTELSIDLNDLILLN